MKEFDFTLKYRLGTADEDPQAYLDALAEAGCDDAVIGIGQSGRIALNFTREAKNALEAISSAIGDVRSAIPNAKLVEATPDYMGLTDIADLFGFSRQYMRKLVQSKGAEFPEPVHEGKPSIWHLSEVLFWFEANEPRKVKEEVLEVSRINMQLNVFKSCVWASSAFKDGFHFAVDAPNKSLQRTFDPPPVFANAKNRRPLKRR